MLNVGFWRIQTGPLLKKRLEYRPVLCSKNGWIRESESKSRASFLAVHAVFAIAAARRRVCALGAFVGKKKVVAFQKRRRPCSLFFFLKKNMF